VAIRDLPDREIMILQDCFIHSPAAPSATRQSAKVLGGCKRNPGRKIPVASTKFLFQRGIHPCQRRLLPHPAVAVRQLPIALSLSLNIFCTPFNTAFVASFGDKTDFLFLV